MDWFALEVVVDWFKFEVAVVVPLLLLLLFAIKIDDEGVVDDELLEDTTKNI